MIPPSSHDRSAQGFTLVELMVVLVIIAMLSSLTLAGLSRARHRAKVDKTKSTIRKLNELIVPHYDSYVRRRVPFAAGLNARGNAENRLLAIRRLLVYEMPDSWADVFSDEPAAVNSGFSANGTVRSFARYRDTVKPSATNASAECLYMIIALGSFEADALQIFRADEIGDTDNDGADGAPEFLDGWGRPIEFYRWAPGFSRNIAGAGPSPIQVADSSNHPDPFDPQRVDPNAYALIPLIVSRGPDGDIGLQPQPPPPTGWHGQDLRILIVAATESIGAPVSPTSSDHLDNVTNHDLLSK